MQTDCRGHMVFGACLFGLGLFISCLTILAATNSPSGGYYVICIGAIIGGLAEFLYGLEGWLAEREPFARDPFAKAPLELKALTRTLIYGASIEAPLNQSAIQRVQRQLTEMQGKKYRPATIKKAARAMDREGVDVCKYLAREESNLSENFKYLLLQSFEAVLFKGLSEPKRQSYLQGVQDALRLRSENTFPTD